RLRPKVGRQCKVHSQSRLGSSLALAQCSPQRGGCCTPIVCPACFAMALRDQLHGIAHPNLAVVRIGLESELASGAGSKRCIHRYLNILWSMMPASPPGPLQVFKAEFFKALAHPLRIRMLEILAAGGRTVQELQDALGVEQPVVSQQLAV